jgi:large subunit ribosomal protein L23
MESSDVIKYPLATEKSIRLMESENKLIFVVDRRANKFEIKKAIEETFNTKVDNVRTYVSPSGEKRAYIKFSRATPAIDVATNLGLM